MPFEYTTLRERKVTFAFFETAAITILDFLLCFLFHRQDIFFLNSGGFPWMLIGPLLIALLYGLPYAFASHIILLIAGSITNPPLDWILSEPLRLYLFGSTLVILVCGQFGSYWKLRMEHIEQLNKYLRERIDYLVRTYYLVKVSHDLIEQQFISRPFSLRNTFYELREMLILNKGELTPAVMSRFLELMSQYLQIESAQIYLMTNGQLNEQAAAVIGTQKNILNKKDPLIEISLENKITNFVSVAQFDDHFKSDYLVVAPLTTTEETMLGLLVIDDIAYRSLNNVALEKLMVFLSYFSNMKFAIDESRSILEKYPSCPVEFAHELIQLNALQKKYGVNSYIICVKIADIAKKDFYLENLEQQKRNLDVVWELIDNNKCIFVVLMPFSDAAGVLSYIIRIKKFFKVTYNVEVDNTKIYFRYFKLSKNGVDETLKELMREG